MGDMADLFLNLVLNEDYFIENDKEDEEYNMNSVNLIGRLGQNPEMKYFESGKVKTTFSIAVKKFSKDENKNTVWIDIECWDKTAEIAGEYLKKGHSVGIEGSIDEKEWTTEDNIVKRKLFVNASKIDLIEKKDSPDNS